MGTLCVCACVIAALKELISSLTHINSFGLEYGGLMALCLSLDPDRSIHTAQHNKDRLFSGSIRADVYIFSFYTYILGLN